MFKRIVEIAVEDLAVGMYVCALDRPWIDTPFLFQGLLIKEQGEIDTLRSLCTRVRVEMAEDDTAQSLLHARTARHDALPPPNDIFSSATPRIVDVKCPAAEEMPSAARAHVELAETLSSAMEDLRSGRTLAIEQLRASTRPLIDSIERNPDALACLSTMRRKDAGMHRHAISAAVLVLTCGRHLGLPRAALESLAIGGLLFDVGKTRVSDTVLMKPDRLTDAEFEAYKRHVELGAEILAQCRGVDDAVLSMLRTHHERHDGSGYPLGLSGDRIPAFGKIAGIADAYQTMLESTTAGRRLSAHDVLNYLNKQRGKLFEPALVEEFIQAIGIYPTGTIVKLSDGCIGVVVEQNRLRRLQPRIMLILDHAEKRLPSFETIDLLVENANSNALQIVACFEPGAFGIDAEELFL